MGFRSSRLVAFSLLVSASVATGARADPLDKIQGAWALQDSDCGDVFTTDQGKIALRKRQDDMVPGFILDGKRLHSGGASCTITSAKEKADGLALLLSCQTNISFATLSVVVQTPDPDTLVQSASDFPEVTTSYHKCSPQAQ